MKILSNFDVFSFYCILYFNYFKTFSYAPFKLKCNTIYNLKKINMLIFRLIEQSHLLITLCMVSLLLVIRCNKGSENFGR